MKESILEGTVNKVKGGRNIYKMLEGEIHEIVKLSCNTPIPSITTVIHLEASLKELQLTGLLSQLMLLAC